MYPCTVALSVWHMHSPRSLQQVMQKWEPWCCHEGTLLLHQRISLVQLLVCMQNYCIDLVGGLLCSALGLTVGLVCLALNIVPRTLDFTCSSSPPVLSQQRQSSPEPERDPSRSLPLASLSALLASGSCWIMLYTMYPPARTAPAIKTCI